MLDHKQQQQQQQQRHGTSGLTIQERIRAMNETLDSVGRLPPTTDGTSDGDTLTNEMIFNVSSPIVVAPPVTHKRTSVVDIWRKRESNTPTIAHVPVETVAATKKPSQTNLNGIRPVRNDNSRLCQETLNDVKTELSIKFLGVACASVAESAANVPPPDASEEKKEDEKEEDAELSLADSSVPINRTKWNGAMRGVASASPTPPPLPKSNRKSYATTATASTSPSSNVVPSAPPPPPPPQPSHVRQKINQRIPTATNTFFNHSQNEEPADLTILPALSSASSCMESEAAQSSTKRSHKVASIWQKLNTTSSGVTTAVTEAAIPMSSQTKHGSEPMDSTAASPRRLDDASVTNTTPPPSYKRSVVDIWQKRVSPASSLPTAAPVERANVDSKIVVERPLNVEAMATSTSPERKSLLSAPVPNVQSVFKQPSWKKQLSQQQLSSPKHNVVSLTPSPPSVKSVRSSYERQRSERSCDGAQLESNPSTDTNRARGVERGGSRNLDAVSVTAVFQQGVVKEKVPLDRLADDLTIDVHTLDLESKVESATDQWGHRSVHDNGKVESPMLRSESMKKSPSSTLSSPDSRPGGSVAVRWKARMDSFATGKREANNGSQRSNSVSSHLSVIPIPSPMSEHGKSKGRVLHQWNDRHDQIKAPPVYSTHDDCEDREAFRQSFSASPAMSENSRKFSQLPSSPAKETKVVSTVKSPSINLTPSPVHARRTVIDRYPLSGSSSVPGVGLSFRAPISPMMKDYVAHTPAGLSRNKVAGRWIESKSIASDNGVVGGLKSTLNPASLSVLGSGTAIIEAWVDSKAEIRHTKGFQHCSGDADEVIKVQAAIESIDKPVFERESDDVVMESVSPTLNKGATLENQNEGRSDGKRWSIQNVPATPNAFDAKTVADLLNIATSETSAEPYRVVNENHRAVVIDEENEGASGISAIRERWIKRDIGSSHSLPPMSMIRKNASATKSRKEMKLAGLQSHSTKTSVDDTDESDDLCQLTPKSEMVGNEDREVSTSLNVQSPLHKSRGSANVADRWKMRVARASETSLYDDDTSAHQSPTVDHPDEPVSLVGAVDSATSNFSSSYVGSSPGMEPADAPTDIGVISMGDSVASFSDCDVARETKPEESLTRTREVASESGSVIKCADSIGGETVFEHLATRDCEKDHGSTLLPASSTSNIEKTQSDLISKYSRDSVASLRREIEDSQTSEDAADLITSDGVVLAGDGRIGQKCVDELLRDSIAFIPLADIQIPLPANGSSSILLTSDESSKRRQKQDPPVEPRNHSQMVCSHQILDGNPSALSIPTEGSNASDAFESQQFISSDQDPISPHQIIDAWSQQSSLKSSDTPETADLVTLDCHTKDSMYSDAVVRPANSSAFAPWNSPADNRSDDVLSEGTTIKNKKNFMLLGRRHLVSKTPKKPEEATKTIVPATTTSDKNENDTRLKKRMDMKTQHSTDKITSPSLSLSSEDTSSMVLLQQKSATTNKAVIGYHHSAHLASDQQRSDAASTLLSQRGKETFTAATSSSSTRKLASDKLLNKKRLQLYRRKTSKPALAEVESESSAPATEDYLYATESLNREFTDDQESQVTGPTPQIAPFDSDAIQRTNSDFAPLSSSGMDEKNLQRSTRSESGQSYLSENDVSAFDDICRTSSSVTSSVLANKAEKLLQQRRKRIEPDDLVVVNEDPLVVHNTGFSPPPMASRRVTDETPYPYHTDREEMLLENGRPRLSTRYNTSSRFMDADGSTASMSAPGMTTDGSESIGSSCVQSLETATSGSDSRFFAAKQHLPEAETHKRRLARTVKAPSEIIEEKSVNTSGHSAWDSDWVSDVGLDFNKFALAVDERVAALRDFVGGQVKKQSKSSSATQRNDLMEVEDVAIEVEYVEDSDNDCDYDEDDDDDLGLCSEPLDKAMKRSFHCSETKAAMERHFPTSCNEMLPTGQPSFEQKPTSLNGRSGYA